MLAAPRREFDAYSASSPPPRRAGAAVLALALLATHATLLALTLTRRADFLFNDARHRLGPGSDFAAYYVAALEWRTGGSLYGHGPGYGYRYHPLFGLTVANLLSRADFTVAYGVWVAVHESLLLVFVVWLRRLLRDARLFWAALVVLTLYSPYYLEVYMGNSTFIVTVLLCLFLHALQRGNLPAATAWLTTSLLIKPLGVVFVPWLLTRRLYATIAIALGLTLATAVPYFLRDPQSLGLWWQVNAQAVPLPGWVIHGGNQGLHGLCVALFVRLSGIPADQFASYAQLPAAARATLMALPGALLVLSLAATWRLRASLPIPVFVWSATYLLGYKDVWEHSYVFIMPGLAWLWSSGAIDRRLVAGCALGLALPTAFVFYDPPLPPGPVDPERYWSLPLAALHHATKPLWVLVLYTACLLKALWRRNGRP